MCPKTVKSKFYLEILSVLPLFKKDDRFPENIVMQVKALESKIGVKVEELNELQTLKGINFVCDENSCPSWKLVGLYSHMLITVLNEIDLNINGSPNLNQINFINSALQTTIVFGLTPCFSDDLFVTDLIVVERDQIVSNKNPDVRYKKICSLLEMCKIFLKYEILRKSNVSLYIKVFAGIFTVMYMSKKHSDTNNQLSPELFKNAQKNVINIENIYTEICNQLIPSQIIIYLMFLKGKMTSSKVIQRIIDDCLIKEICKENGYLNFVEVIICQQSKIADTPWRTLELISNIIAGKKRKKEYYINVNKQVTDVLLKYMTDTNRSAYVSGSIMCLKKLYDLSIDYIMDKIEEVFLGKLNKLCNPTDLLAGIIILDDLEFKSILLLNYTAFCAPNLETMRTKIIIPYLPILIKLYGLVPDNSIEQKQILSIIIQCLGNRNTTELHAITDCILYDQFLQGMKQMHPKVIVKFNKNHYSIQIIKEVDELPKIDITEIYVKILKNSNHNQLIYKIFLTLLKMLEHCIDTNDKDNIACTFDLDVDDLTQLVSHKFRKQFIVINCLSEIMKFKDFHSQINELNGNDIFQFIKNLLKNKIEKGRNGIKSNMDEQIIIIILSIFREISWNFQNTSSKVEIRMLMEELLTLSISSSLHDQLVMILKEINNHSDLILVPEISQYQAAITLCREKESYLRVNGMAEIIKLLNDNDEETISNKHTILALAMFLLKDEESYTFQKSIKLLIALSDIFESEILEALIADYENDEIQIDLRLKIGEFILLLTEKLKELSYNYKSILINCFMRGSTNKNDEYRTSSLANLGILCKFLCYQIHNFFEELMTLINNTIIHDKYLPARRGAVSVLSHILFGIENLMDFQQFLLPIYRTLKSVILTESDEVTLVHAEIGLDHLKNKTKLFLFPEQKLIKEIKILNINNNATVDKKKPLIQIID